MKILVTVVFVLLFWAQDGTRGTAEEKNTQPRIDRRALVARHAMQFDRYAPESPASLGNGEFAFTFDITGLQTFPSDEPGHIPLGTMAQWSWHTFPSRENFRYEQTLREFDVHGRKVTYSTDMRSEAAQAIRANPHRFNLAQIGLRLLDGSGERVGVELLQETSQTVDLWTGKATSRFVLDGQPVEVVTVVHPSLDAVAVTVHSPLLALERVALEIRFAYPAGVWGPRLDDWHSEDKHSTKFSVPNRLERKLDTANYAVELSTNGELEDGDSQHQYFITQHSGDSLEAVVLFSDGNRAAEVPTFAATQMAAAAHWEEFWTTGGAIDLSQSKDPRWRELERRIVLSQFLTAVNCAGSLPPQETGLVCNSWFGKSHLEMHWWHAAHFPLWDRFELLERSLPWYDQILPAARSIAERQGYAGVRWPKMTGPAGVSSPSEVGELLIWQQPHPIYFAEQAYRNSPTEQTLRRYQSVVEQTAAFMADYAYFDESTDRYVLGPVLIPAQECYEGRSKEGVLNPTFELAYWRWALQVANEWRTRLGLEPEAKWAEVAAKIARPPVREGVYTAIENPPYTRRRDHPSMLAALGVLPDVGLIDAKTMGNTLDDVVADWQWPDTWGWDYPMMAMTAVRLGRPAAAIDYLLLDTPKNHYLPNGHCRQADRLPIYLPANGGLLTAVAMMAAGWDGAPANSPAPGFPNDGNWSVRFEGLRPMP